MAGRSFSRRRVLALAGAGAALSTIGCGQAPPPAPTSQAATTPQVQIVEKVVTATPGAQPTPPQPAVKVVTATPPPQIGGDITIWTFPLTKDDQNNLWKGLTEKFKKEEPKINAKIEVLPWDGRREKMMTAFAAGAPPEVAYVNTDTLSLFGASNVLLDLDKVIPPDVWADYPKGVTGAGLSWQGKRIMIPTLLIVTGRIANQELLSAAGWPPDKPPFVWSDVLQLAARTKERGVFVTNWSLVNWEQWMSTVWQAGGAIFSEDATKVLLDQPPAEEALTFIVDLFQKGYVPKEGAVASEQEAAAAAAVDYFITGKQALSGAENPNIIDRVKQQAAAMKYTLMPPFKHKEQVAPVSSGCWGIFNRGKNIDAAARWVNFMVGPETQGFYCSVAGFIPPRQAASAFWVVQDDLRKLVNAQLPFTRITQDANYFWQEGKTTCAPFFQSAVLGKSTPKQALAGAAAGLQKTVDAFWAKQKK